MKIKNPNTGEIISVPKGMENAVKQAIKLGKDPLAVMANGGHMKSNNKLPKAANGKVVSEIWQDITGLPWSEAKKLGLTTGTYDQNIKLREALLANPEKFKSIKKEDKARALYSPKGSLGPSDMSGEYIPETPKMSKKDADLLAVQQMFSDYVPAPTATKMPINPFDIFNKGVSPRDQQLLADQSMFSDYSGPYGQAIPQTNKPVFIPKNTPYLYNNYPFEEAQSTALRGYESGEPFGLRKRDFGGNLMTDYYYANGGEMIKRADGSYSRRGLWDNIRANAGSGKKPTKEMLKQEAHIRAMEKALGGEIGLYEQGGIDNPGFRALPDYVQQNILDNMAYGGYMASGGCMECGGMMESGGKIPTEVLRSRLEAHMSPNEVENYLDSYAMGGSIPEAKNGKWIQKAINPKHKGYCTPMTKSTCTPKRKALALTLKKMAKSRKKEEGGYVEGKEYEMTDSEIARLRAMGYKISEL